MARTFIGNITKGIKLEYSSTSTGTYTEVEGIQNIPDVGGNKESIETTCLDNDAHTYIAGLKAVPDSFDFTLLHDKTQFATLAALTGKKYWKLTLPDGTDGAAGTVASWEGECSVKINGAGVNEAITDTLSVKPSTDITFS